MRNKPGGIGILFFGIACILFAANAHADYTVLVSVNSEGVQGNGASGFPSISADGRYVAFQSGSDNLVPNDNNGATDVFVHDLQTHRTVIVSRSANGDVGDRGSTAPSISGDGRYVAFESAAGNLVPGGDNVLGGVFVIDRDADGNGVYDEPGGTSIERVSVDVNGNPAGGDYPSISADGRYVAFESGSLLAGNNTGGNVYVRDRLSGTTELASVSYDGMPVHASVVDPMISADGRFVAFLDGGGQLTPEQTVGWQVYFRDRTAGTTELVSVNLNGTGSAKGQNWLPSCTADGRFVVFSSCDSDLVKNDKNYECNVFLRDRLSGTTSFADVNSAGRQGNDGGGEATISSDGRYIVFDSKSTNLVRGYGGYFQVYLRDVVQNDIEIVSVDNAGIEANNNCGRGYEHRQAVSADGRYTAFVCLADNLVPGDNNASDDVFVRVRQ